MPIHDTRLLAHPPDVLLHPDVEGYGSLDFKELTGPRLAGIAEAERCLPELRDLVNGRV